MEWRNRFYRTVREMFRTLENVHNTKRLTATSFLTHLEKKKIVFFSVHLLHLFPSQDAIFVPSALFKKLISLLSYLSSQRQTLLILPVRMLYARYLIILPWRNFPLQPPCWHSENMEHFLWQSILRKERKERKTSNEFTLFLSPFIGVSVISLCW